MATLSVFNSISMDGCFTGANGDLIVDFHRQTMGVDILGVLDRYSHR